MDLLDSALCKLQFSAKAAVENARVIISRVRLLGIFSSKKMRTGEPAMDDDPDKQAARNMSR